MRRLAIALSRAEIWAALHMAATGTWWSAHAARRLARLRGTFSGNASGGLK